MLSDRADGQLARIFSYIPLRYQVIVARTIQIYLFLGSLLAIVVLYDRVPNCMSLLTCRASTSTGHLLVYAAVGCFGVVLSRELKDWRAGLVLMLAAGAGYEVTWDGFNFLVNGTLHPQFFISAPYLVVFSGTSWARDFVVNRRAFILDVGVLSLWAFAGLPVTVAHGLPTALYIDPSTSLIEQWGWMLWLAIAYAAMRHLSLSNRAADRVTPSVARDARH